MTLRKKAFVNIVGQGENAGNKHFPVCQNDLHLLNFLHVKVPAYLRVQLVAEQNGFYGCITMWSLTRYIEYIALQKCIKLSLAENGLNICHTKQNLEKICYMYGLNRAITDIADNPLKKKKN